MTAYTLVELQKISWEATAAPFYNTVIIKRPPEKIVKKWQLAVEKDIANILVMPHVTKEQIDALIEDLKNITP